MTSKNLSEAFKGFLHRRLPQMSQKSVQAVLEMSAEGATVPFMARYRKERTGNLDEVEIRAILDLHEEHQEITKRRDFILKEVEKQGNLTQELKGRIEACDDLGELEEIYRPFKRKKKTKATLAREAGLEPMADWLWSLGQGELKDEKSLEVKAKEFINPTLGYATYEEVLRGAQHILVEKISNQAHLRQLVREEFKNNGKVVSAKTTKFKTHSKYEMYGEFSEAVKNLAQKKASHRYLALRRGWQEGELKVSIEADEPSLLKTFEAFAVTDESSQATAFLKDCAKQALMVHVIPSITNEIHRELKEQADKDAIGVFAENVRRVLMGSPFGPKRVLGVDPGLRTGCKLALIDSSGHFISHTVLHTQGEQAKEKAKQLFADTFKQVKIEAVAVGNGTGGREAEAFIREIFKELEIGCPVILINESGASVYSASEVARNEFPDLDLTVRGAISIARRLQDPLSELVKIDPKSIGVGQYQHDVPQSQIKKSLHEVVESCVNQVGVDLNTASESLLQYVSGIGPALAANIVSHRRDKGLFQERSDLLKVPQFSSKVFEQSGGFLRIAGGKISLDATGIHPERYTAVRDMAHELGVSVSQLMGEGAKKLREIKEKWAKLVGEFTFEDIVAELEKPGRDPRDPFKVFQYREDIHEVKDLKQDMICPGVVTNVTNFGAFVDIGVHQDGLVHISELSDKFVDDPSKVVSPGDQVKVKVLAVDLDKNQISLSMKLENKPRVVERVERADRAERSERSARGPAAQRRGAGGGAKKAKPRSGQRPSEAGGRPGRGQKPGQKKPGADQRRPGKPFNNPFAALGNLKG